jgi:hypothetical protein
MMNIPSNPKTAGKVLSLKFPISRTAAIAIKITPTNSAIFWNIILHMLISPQMLYRLSLERLSLYHIGENGEKIGSTLLLPHFSGIAILVWLVGLKFDPPKESYLEGK